MPIPYQDRADGEAAAAVAYLRVLAEPDRGELQAALFIANGGGAPLEFCFTRAEVDSGTLWQPEPAYRRAVVALFKALFEAVRHQPDLALALAEEVPAEIFDEDIEVHVPLCLVARAPEPGESPDNGDSGANTVIVQWLNGELADGTLLSRLVESLKDRNLLLEPFQRAALGLEEAYASQ